MKLRTIILLLSAVVTLSAFAPANDKSSAAEQQQISIATPNLFAQSDAFSIEMGLLGSKEYSFPLPVGKAEKRGDNRLAIVTSEGDAVKAMFDGVVRLSRNHPDYGNVIVIRHYNGLETVYGNNAQNLVSVGDVVTAGQTIAIVGSKDGKTYLDFSIMINGARINPETVIGLKSHRLHKQTLHLFGPLADGIEIDYIGIAGYINRDTTGSIICSSICTDRIQRTSLCCACLCAVSHGCRFSLEPLLSPLVALALLLFLFHITTNELIHR